VPARRFWEFVNDKVTVDLIKDVFPGISEHHQLTGHIFERRDRLYLAQGFDDGMAFFVDEIRKAVERAGGDQCAAEALEAHGIRVPKGSMLYGAGYDKRSRLRRGGLDPWKEQCPTIASGGLTLVRPNGRAEKIPNSVALWIRTRGGARDFFLLLGEGKQNLNAKILAMGVSTVIGTALQLAIERWVRERGLS